MSAIANTDQHEVWNGESGARWVARADERDRVLEPVADAILDAAALTPGTTVLDVGCGCGATTLSGAARIGDAGHATGLDLSRPMLDVARRRAAASGLANVRFVAGDAQTHRVDDPVDVAISRFGTMFFADPVAAFANLRIALVPGGRLCLATWSSLDDNEWLVVPGAALLPYARLPAEEPGAPGMFAQSEPDLVRATLTDAGYREIRLDPVEIELTVGDTIDEAAGFLADTGPGRRALESVPDDRLDQALDAVRLALEDHVTETGVTLGAGIWIVRATR